MITSQDREIQALVSDVRDGRLLLPELQRRYVWKAPQVRDLFDSLYYEYPSGQLLLWETGDIPFSRTTSIEAVAQDQPHPQLLLDGQQRVTSLASVMLGRPLIVRGLRRPIDIVFNPFIGSGKFEVANNKHRQDAGWVSLKKLFTEGLLQAIRDLKLDINNPDNDQAYERLKRVDNIRTYKYRVNLLRDLSYEEVTHIFVRVNSGGTKLGNSDLALAQLSSRWRGVTEEFDAYQAKAAKRELDLDSGLLLRAMAVLLGRSSRLSELFKGDRQSIELEDLKNAWERTKFAMDRALDFVVHNCRIDRLSMFTYHSVLIPLVVFFDRFQEVSERDSRLLQKWVYMALIWSRYSSTVETKLDQDVSALAKPDPVRMMLQNIEDVIGKGRHVTERELQDQRKNSAYLTLAYVLARDAGAEDWFSGVKIGPNQPLDLHHIFPKGLLREHYDLKADSLIVDQVANLAFLSRRANAKISASAPSVYLPQVATGRLRAQTVPQDPNLWTLDGFEGFLLRRRTMLADEINRLLQSLDEKPSLWPISSIQILESRIDSIERVMREVVADALTAAWGPSAWEKCVPGQVRSSLEERIRFRLERNPTEVGATQSLLGKLAFAQFSDYPKIVRQNWQIFGEHFGSQPVFDQHIRAVVEARNAFKHNRDLSPSELASCEAGLLWLEDSLRAASEDEDEEEDDGAVAS